MLAILTVSVDDDGAVANNDGDLTLREAIAYVNLDALPDTEDLKHIEGTIGTNDQILFSTIDGTLPNGAPVTNLNGSTILLTEGVLNITESAIIDATMLSQGITIDAIGNDSDGVLDNGTGTSVFVISPSVRDADEQITLAGLTITGGDAPNFGGGIFLNPFYETDNDITLKIHDSVIKANHVSNGAGNGGGLAVDVAPPEDSSVVVEILRSEFISNTAENSGGGIYVQHVFSSSFMGGGQLRPFKLTIDESTIRDNTAFGTDEFDGHQGSGGGGGGIYVAMDGNKVNNDGAIFNLKNSTVSGNTAVEGQGGGV